MIHSCSNNFLSKMDSDNLWSQFSGYNHRANGELRSWVDIMEQKSAT